MHRPKSASSTSFLDDLLGNEIENAVRPSSSSTSSSASQRQRKSVRFFDEDDEGDESVATQQSSRPHSSTLDSLLSASRSQDAKPKNDWLGISSSEEETPKPSSSTSASTSRATSAFASMIAPRGGRAQSATSGSSSDWLSAGLQARSQASLGQPKDSVEDSGKPSSPNKARPWKPKTLGEAGVSVPVTEFVSVAITTTTSTIVPAPAAGLVSGTSTTTTTTASITTSPNHAGMLAPTPVNMASNNGKIAKVELNELERIDESLLMERNADSKANTSVTYLQTQLRMATLEKTFLEQTVAQMKNNHQDELRAMVQLYEQQMRLTSQMYTRHEAMIQEEHDHRTTDMKSYMTQLELEMNKMTEKYKQRLEQVETEWRQDVTKTREGHALALQQINQQHQQELQTLEKKLELENGEALEASNNLARQQTKTFNELLVKWEESAHKIEKLQKTVIARQEELARDNKRDQQSDRGLEIQWNNFLEELQKHKSQFEVIFDKERQRIDAETTKQIEESNRQLEKQREELQKMKMNFVQEVNDWRENQANESLKIQKEREKLREDVLVFEQRRSLLETLYNERKTMQDQEHDRLASRSEEIRTKQEDLDRRQAELMKTLFDMKQAEEQLKLSREQFDQEKEQLKQLGVTLFGRAEELEKLSEMTLKEKMEAVQAMQDIDAFKAEIDSKMQIIEQSSKHLRAEEAKLAQQQAQLDQSWEMVQQLRDSIVCNLCGNAISQAKFWPSRANMIKYGESVTNVVPSSSSSSSQVFYSLMNGFSKPDQVAPNMDDNSLLLWQVSSQKDEASLAEETRFLAMLRQRRSSKQFTPVNLKH